VQMNAVHRDVTYISMGSALLERGCVLRGTRQSAIKRGVRRESAVWRFVLIGKALAVLVWRGEVMMTSTNAV